MLPDKLRLVPAMLEVDRLRAFLEETIAAMTAETLRIPQSPENVALFVQAGNNLAALAILKNHLPE